MYTDRVVNPIQPVFLKNSTEFRKQSETFHDVFYRTMNRSNSRPPKMELTGILVPCDEVVESRHYKYKLETDSDDYLLSMTENLIAVAKKAEWEKVTVKGTLNMESGIFEVEKLTIINESQSFKPNFGGLHFDIENYKKAIARLGKLEPIPDYLAS